MNKQIKALFVFLILLIILVAITTVNAADTNKTVSKNTLSYKTSSSTVVTETKTSNINTQKIYSDNWHKSYNTNTENNKTKSLEKKLVTNDTSKNAVSTKLTVSTNKTVPVGTQIAITGKLTANGKNIAAQQITINIDGSKYTAKTTKDGIYRIIMTPKTSGTKKVTVNFAGTEIYSSSSATQSITVNKITSKLTINTNKTIPIGTQIAITGKLTGNNKNIATQPIIINIDGSKYTAKTTKDGIYRIIMTPKTSGTKTITASYTGTEIYSSSSATQSITINKITSKLTINTNKTIPIGTQIAITGKLTANGKNIAVQQITINIDGSKYAAKTTKDGIYRIIMTPKTSGTKTITASYTGTEIYSSSSATQSITVNKIASKLTVTTSSSITLGTKIVITGKLTGNNKNIAAQPITVSIDGIKYTTKTAKDGTYKIQIRPNTAGSKTITVSYAGNNNYKSCSVKTTFKVIDIYKTLELYTYKLNHGDYYPTVKYVDNDIFYAWYQTYDMQDSKGVHVESDPEDITDMGDPSNNLIVDATFYFRNRAGHIYTDSYDNGNGDYMYHSLVSGYTPYKVVIKYRAMTSYEKYLWNNGYDYNPRTQKWDRYLYH